jgi:hypothetical protein
MQLPLDDIVQVMRRCVNGKFSRSAIAASSVMA